MQAGSTSIQSGFTLLSALEESDLDWIFATGREEPAPTGAVVVQEGVRGEFIYFVLEGLLSVSSAALGRREIARLGPGQIFGEMSFLEDRPTSATISAVEDSLVLAVARADLESKLAADSALAARIYKALAIIAAGRLRELVGTLARWMEVEERVSIVSPMLERWQEIARLIHDRHVRACRDADRLGLARERRQRIACHLMRRLGHAIGLDDRAAERVLELLHHLRRQ